jgi:subtilisin family serine protease
MKTRIIFLFILLISTLSPDSVAQSFFWVGFSDKPSSGYSLSRPLEFLSPRSVQRRTQQHILLSESDLPVCKVYIDSVLKIGGVLIHSSKWLNGVTVQLKNDSLANRIGKLGFVREMQMTKPGTATKSATRKFDEDLSPANGIDTSYYGMSVYQVGQLNGQFLHNNGYKGKGMLIAILDAGFYHVNLLPAFDSLRFKGRIAGTRDFVNPSSNIYEENTHGMMVLSTMGGNVPGQLIGTAPEATYWLIRSEDASTEYLIEEDNWVAAAEFADSLGADVINSSLGYYVFDNAGMNHTYADMNGKTTRVARGANMAVSKGILVFASAGNEGNKTWHYLITPSDGDSVIAVAAVDKNGIKAAFSSFGPAPDGNVKPDLAAMGQSTALESYTGQVGLGSGTSFSSPVLAGIAACLWQANPQSTASMVKNALIRSGSQYQKPDSLLGYGIPNMLVASTLLSKSSFVTGLTVSEWMVFPNPFHTSFTFFSSGTTGSGTTAEINDISGKMVLKTHFPGPGPYQLDATNLPPGIFFLKLSTPKGTEVHKIIKTK